MAGSEEQKATHVDLNKTNMHDSVQREWHATAKSSNDDLFNPGFAMPSVKNAVLLALAQSKANNARILTAKYMIDPRRSRLHDIWSAIGVSDEYNVELHNGRNRMPQPFPEAHGCVHMCAIGCRPFRSSLSHL